MVGRESRRSGFGAVWAAGLGLAFSTLSACGDSTTEPVLEPEPIPSSRSWLDLAYADQSASQRLDIHLPPSGEGPFPLVIWIHGGAWISGDKGLGRGHPARMLTERGYAVASLNYRLSLEAQYPAAVWDVKAAVRWLRAHAVPYHLGTESVGVWGSSAGGHLAALLGTSAGVGPLEGGSLGNSRESSRVQAVVAWYAPTDFLEIQNHADTQGCPLFQGIGHDSPISPEGLWLGGAPSSVPQVAEEASPVTWASADDPPFLIQHGLSDCTVPWRQSGALAEALREHLPSSEVELEYLVAGHGGGEFSTLDTFERVAEFLDRWLR